MKLLGGGVMLQMSNFYMKMLNVKTKLYSAIAATVMNYFLYITHLLSYWEQKTSKIVTKASPMRVLKVVLVFLNHPICAF